MTTFSIEITDAAGFVRSAYPRPETFTAAVERAEAYMDAGAASVRILIESESEGRFLEPSSARLAADRYPPEPYHYGARRRIAERMARHG